MKCLICKAQEAKSIKENKYFPFCSARCKNIDLYNWLNGEYNFKDKLEPDYEN